MAANGEAATVHPPTERLGLRAGRLTSPETARPSRWQLARRILAVRLDSMGDVLMTTPAIRALREAVAGREVTLLTSPSGAGIARLVPEIDDVIVYEAPWLKATPPGAGPEAEFEMIETLRARAFDAAVIFTVYSQNPLPSAMLCYLAGIPLRLAHCRENPYQLLTDRLPELEPERLIRHEVRRQLDLVAAVGARPSSERLSLRVPETAAARVSTLLTALGLGEGPAAFGARPAGARWIALHPGASAPSRRYPPELWSRAASALSRRLGCRIVFTGSAAEGGLIEEIRHGMDGPSVSLAGSLDLGELAALLAAAPLLVAGNTGPVHIAAAVGTPVVDVYALTNPQHTPWAVPNRVLNHDVPCRNCYSSVCPMGHHACLREVPPERIADAAFELVGGRREAAPVAEVVTAPVPSALRP